MSVRPKRCADGADQIFLPIANDGLEGDGHADFVELFCDVKRVGVLSERSKHLGADSDDFRFHICSD